MRYPFLLILVLAAICAAQEPVLKVNSFDADPGFSVGEVRGTIKRKALYLPKPSYPRTALDAGADGTVNVEIVVDGDGNVISAKAASGDAALFPVCEETALRTKFRRIEGVGPEYKETARLTYIFALSKLSWFRIGFDLSVLQDSPTLAVINFRHMERLFSPDWTPEREITARLTEIGVADRPSNPFTPRPVLQKDSKSNKSTMTGTVTLPQPRLNSAEASALALSLSTALESRLAGDAKSFWEFATGHKLASYMRLNRDSAERKKTAEMIRFAIEKAPADIEPEKIEALRGLATVLDVKKLSGESHDEIRRLLTTLYRNK